MLYEVQGYCNEWFRLSVWRMEPTDLSRFLTHLLNMLNAGESCDELRVRRIPDEWGLAQWDFDGEHHSQAHH